MHSTHTTQISYASGLASISSSEEESCLVLQLFLLLLHCKKERIILTNFGHLSCIPLCSKSSSKVCQKFACTSNLLIILERCISLISLFKCERLDSSNSLCLMMLYSMLNDASIEACN